MSDQDHRSNLAHRLDPEPAESVRPVEDGRDSVDFFDVPAAVLCAVCGDADCEGCLPHEDDDASGVIAIVPWERPGGTFKRLFATANSATAGADSFFGAMPRGAVEPALTFAIVAEGLAVSSLVGTSLAILLVAFPELTMQLIFDTQLARDVGRWLAIGIPAVTLWMVGVHALHGVVTNRAAHGMGGPHLPRRALRFGLYACGWDLMTSPLGLLVTLFSRGAKASAAMLGAVMTVPGRATHAMVKGAYRLDEEAARKVHRRAVGVAMLVTILSILLLAVGALFA